MTIHYHGLPITPVAQMLKLAGRHFCVSYAASWQVERAHLHGQSVMLDNGAFTHWRRGALPDWAGYYDWAAGWLDYRTTWAVIPDVIDGDGAANDALLAQWPHGERGAPVWHMHEPTARLLALCGRWPRVCLGSSGKYSQVGTTRWHRRMRRVMNELCGDGPPPCWLHMLRGGQFAGGPYPFASVDSTNIAQNHAPKPTRAQSQFCVREMANRLDALQCPPRWCRVPEDVSLF